MSKCKECGIDVVSEGTKPKLFCSDACRMRYKRTKQTNIEQTNTQPEQGNPLALPGDLDYVGCCKLVDGDWQVDNTKPDVEGMSDDELVRRLHYIKEWQRSPEHKEVLRRRRAVA